MNVDISEYSEELMAQVLGLLPVPAVTVAHMMCVRLKRNS